MFAEMTKKFGQNRVNGCVDVDVPISKPDWYEIQETMDMLNKINEGDLIQFCLQYKLADLKRRGIE